MQRRLSPPHHKRRNKEELVTLALLIPLAALFLFPIFLVFYNSFMGSVFISNEPFVFPSRESFVGFKNYLSGLKQSGFLGAMWRSLLITVSVNAYLGYALAGLLVFTKGSDGEKDHTECLNVVFIYVAINL